MSVTKSTLSLTRFATMNATRCACISAGSNLGDRAENLRGGLRALGELPGVRVVAVSSVYETDPVGGVPQPAYLNVAARLDVAAALSPETLLAGMQKIERTFGRRREDEIRWGPRTLDLDLLLFGGEMRATEFLTLPHPRMWERAFVLIPLREVADAQDAWLAEKLEKIPKDTPSVRLYSGEHGSSATP
jgi:2-amino-4-hydroxy-6-hydroxymethyldihydropteridine diphosphokinase